jgi:hypothetical protein
MQLSTKAITELREVLRKTYGEVFESALTDDDIDHLGKFFLEVTIQGLKLRMQKHS